MKNIWFVIGIICYIVMSLIDRVFLKLNNVVYIIGVSIAIVFMFIGLLMKER